jgi:DUF1680 family protein
MKISPDRRIVSMVFALALLVVAFSSCARDAYERRADIINDHVEAFYAYLKANRVEAAMHENHRIEAMADEMAETVKKQAQLRVTSHVEREFALMKTARETAAQNWIALGQYFAIKQQPEKARASYQRVVETYTNPEELRYREHAARAIEDLKITAPSSGRPTH